MPIKLTNNQSIELTQNQGTQPLNSQQILVFMGIKMKLNLAEEVLKG